MFCLFRLMKVRLADLPLYLDTRQNAYCLLHNMDAETGSWKLWQYD